jgi:hypothetical protein
VADIVVEVTDDKSLPKAERKRLQVETAPAKSRRAKLVKIADKTQQPLVHRQDPADGLGREAPARVLRVGRTRSGRVPRHETRCSSGGSTRPTPRACEPSISALTAAGRRGPK